MFRLRFCGNGSVDLKRFTVLESVVQVLHLLLGNPLTFLVLHPENGIQMDCHLHIAQMGDFEFTENYWYLQFHYSLMIQ